MAEADLLLTTAEIAAAFAGFAGLVGVIGRGSASDPRRAAALLRYTLEVSLFVVAFSLIPLLPLNYGVETAASWRLSSLLFIIASLIATVAMGLRYKRADLRVSVGSSIVAGVLSVGADLLLLANALGFFGSAVFPVYLTGLFANLGLAGYYFLLVIGSVFSPAEDRDAA